VALTNERTNKRTKIDLLVAVSVAVASEREGVLAQPGGATGASLCGGVAMSFAQTAGSLAGGSLSTKLTMLLLGLADPLDPGITANGGVRGIDHDDFVVLVSGILSDPVRIQNAKRSDFSTDAFLSDRLKRALEFHLVDTVMGWLAISAALGNGLLARSASDANAVDHESLLGAISQTPSLLNAGGLGSAMDPRQLPVLPGSYAKKKPHDVTLLLAPQLVDVFIRPHDN